jgi:hypothetical protein
VSPFAKRMGLLVGMAVVFAVLAGMAELFWPFALLLGVIVGVSTSIVGNMLWPNR